MKTTDKMPILISLIFEEKRIVSKADELMKYSDQLEESIKSRQQLNEMLLQQILREALSRA